MAKLYQATNKENAGGPAHYFFECPGCGCLHSIITPGWSFNGDIDKPTVSPSILVNGNPAAHNPTAKRCHSFVRDGKIQFLADCEHELAGQTVDLPDIDGV